MRPGPICAVVQNFTSIGFTVAEISVTEQIDTMLEIITADYKKRTSVAFVDNYY